MAHVGDAVVTREQLDETVAHFREEAVREGKEFPDEGDPGFSRARAQLLGLLVYRAELSQEAKRLGVRVEDDEVERRLAEGGSEKEGDEEEGFARDSVRSQLELEGIARELTRGVDDAAARNEKLRGFLERMRRTYAGRIRYESGYAPPGS